MEKVQKIKKIAESFRMALGFTQVLSTSGAELLFDTDVVTALYRQRFGITADNKEAFDAAFKAVTEGEGNEISKINSVISSALLPLLVFYKLSVPQEGRHININLGDETITFTQAFFEVRNRVIRRASCVDVALVSQDGTTILFLESKLTEMYESSRPEEEYGKSYKPLYIGTSIEKALNEGGITVEADAAGLLLRSEQKPRYLEGIKQTISHLIGLVRGPQRANQKDYIEAYKTAHRLIYAPILYDTSALFNEQSDECSDFASLYANVIGGNSDSIMETINNWIKNKRRKGVENNKKIEIHPTALTYQNIMKDNRTWLDEKVKAYYGL